MWERLPRRDNSWYSRANRSRRGSRSHIHQLPMIFQFIRGLCQGFFEIGKSLWRSVGRKVRVSFAIFLTLLVAGILVKRYRDSFTDQPPSWLKQKEISSPSLPKPIAAEFEKSIELAQRYSDQRGVPLGSARL